MKACVGFGWRPETAWLIDRCELPFTEVIAENIDPRRPPRALAAAIERGLVIVVHGVSLSLGGAAPPERARVRHLAAVAKALRAPLVSEHVAWSRAGDRESPHFLPVPRTRAQLAVLVDHVTRVQDALPVPLALENVAAPFAWPGDELGEAELLGELVTRTDAQLLLDVANLRANALNFGGDPLAFVDALPLDRIAYLHAAGGARVEAMWRDTHAHAIDRDGLALLAQVLARTGPRPILVERDHAFPSRGELAAELAAVEAVLAASQPVEHEARRPSYPALPAADRTALAADHAALLAALLDPARKPPRGFLPLHIAETRALLDAKLAKLRYSRR